MPMEGFGVFQIPDTQCEQVVLDAIETGYRLLDTASSYKNEEVVGSAVKKAISTGVVKREELFITTKAYESDINQDTQVPPYSTTHKKPVQSFHIPSAEYMP